MTVTRERQSDYSGWEIHFAVTHVLVNDFERGYEISIEHRLDAA